MPPNYKITTIAVANMKNLLLAFSTVDMMYNDVIITTTNQHINKKEEQSYYKEKQMSYEYLQY